MACVCLGMFEWCALVSHLLFNTTSDWPDFPCCMEVLMYVIEMILNICCIICGWLLHLVNLKRKQDHRCWTPTTHNIPGKSRILFHACYSWQVCAIELPRMPLDDICVPVARVEAADVLVQLPYWPPCSAHPRGIFYL